MLPTMLRVRQTFARPRVTDIPGSVARSLEAAGLTIKRGDTVAVGAGSRGIANIDVIVGAAVRYARDLGARPFVFPAMGSHGGGTAEGQLEVLERYGITEATMGCPVRATMDVVQVGEALGLPVWLDRHAAEADWIGLVNRVKPHTDFKGSIESGLFKMMTIGLGKWKGAVQYHRANVNHGYETVITAVGREMLAKARIGFGLGIVENGYDETAQIEAFNAARPGGGRAPPAQERARLDGPAAVLADRPAHRRRDRQEHLGGGHGHQRDRPAHQPASSRSRPIPRSPGSSRSTSPRTATATPPASALPTSRPAGWSTRST